MAQRLRASGAQTGGGIPTLQTNHSSMNQPHFGINVGQNGITNDMMNWQAEPYDVTNPKLVLPFHFAPNANEKGWRRGTPIFIFRIAGVIQTPALDISQVCELAYETAMMKVERRLALGTGDNQGSALKRSFDYDTNNIFSSMEGVRDMLDFAGVLFRAPGPYMRTGRGKDEFTVFAGGPKTAPLQLFGEIDFPNMWDHYPRVISPLQCLWLLIKEIALSDMVEGRGMYGEVRRSSNVSPQPTDTVVALLWYTSPDNNPPQRAQNVSDLYENPTKQPPLYSRSYKKFNMKKDKDGNMVVNPDSFTIEDGLVMLIGTAQQPIAPISNTGDYSNKLQNYSLDEINRKEKIHIYLPRRGHHVIPYY
jgi:hypothetical protein